MKCFVYLNTEIKNSNDFHIFLLIKSFGFTSINWKPMCDGIRHTAPRWVLTHKNTTQNADQNHIKCCESSRMCACVLWLNNTENTLKKKGLKFRINKTVHILEILWFCSAEFRKEFHLLMSVLCSFIYQIKKP